MNIQHTVIVVDNEIKTEALVQNLLAGKVQGLASIKAQKVVEFSSSRIDWFIEEEERHDRKYLTQTNSQPLKSMSSGERKKALLEYLFKKNPQILLLVNPFDSLDIETQSALKAQLQELSESITMVHITNRVFDTMPFTTQFYRYKDKHLIPFQNLVDLKTSLALNNEEATNHLVPLPLKPVNVPLEDLIVFKRVSVKFDKRTVLSEIDWTIKKGEFWQLIGPNGSGKSTLLNLITGDSHKGYGQNLTLFGTKKGSGESVWDLKENIGYFSPAMVDRFKGYHTLENMLISGLHDSVGLYIKPSETEKQKALEWLNFLGLIEKKNRYFHELSIGAKRLVMTARALIKHPPLLILDEPTVGLDDSSTLFFVNMINAYATKSQSAIIYVSHREEPHLKPEKTFELRTTNKGSRGFVNSI